MIDLIKSAAQKMLIDFENTKRLEHNPTKGRAREHSIFENFLKPYLPNRYSIGSGIVIDVESNQSRQQDLIIYDDLYSPKLLDLSSEKLLFVESVFAAIEVKTTLNREEIEDIAKKSASMWSLQKSRPLPIALTPGALLETLHPPILCVGFAYQSNLELEQIAKAFSDIRKSDSERYAVGLVCILRDKNNKSGLILNVDGQNLRNIQLIPTPTSRISRSELDTSGDALLQMYLLIMEHLRLCGVVTTGPNLLQYAQLLGIEPPMIQMPSEEIVGTHIHIDVEGKVYPTSIDKARRLGELTPKIANGTSTDIEILEWFLLMPAMPTGEFIFHQQSRFWINKRPANIAGTAEVYRAVVKVLQGSATQADIALTDQFIALVRQIHLQKAELLMGISPPDVQM